MKFTYLLDVAFRSIVRNKLRSALTMLGIVIGVGSVVAMISMSLGLTAAVRRSISMRGENVLYVFPGSVSSRGVHWGTGSIKTLTAGDAAAIAEHCPSVRAVSPLVRTRTPLIAGHRNWSPGTLEGVSTAYLTVRGMTVAQGRWLSENDVRSGAKVCVIGETVGNELFQYRSPVGQLIRMGNVPFTIIGVLGHRGSDMRGIDQDDTAILPWTTMRRYLAASDFQDVDRLVASALSASAVETAKEEIGALLRERHRIGPDKPEDFNILDMAEIRKSIASTMGFLGVSLTCVAAISLLVGGIGIMNIMLVSVSERTREIGLRMAVGASSWDILWQFLVEAFVLALVGGVAGIGLGVALAKIVALQAHWPTIISPLSMVLAVVFSSGVGILFGFYPAWRASRLDPIECLRYE